MTLYWIVADRTTGEQQFVQSEEGPPPYDPAVFDIAELPRELDTAVERWDWEAGAIACGFTAAEAHDIMWERAKAYRDVERYFATLPVAVEGIAETIMVECDAKSREKVTNLALAATWAVSRGEDFTLTFTDGSVPNRTFTVNAEQTIAIKAAVTMNDAHCHVASQIVRAALAAALAAEVSADDIFAIDITAGYPAAGMED